MSLTDLELRYRDDRQLRVAQWCEAAFGTAQCSVPQRGIRLLEEAAEAAQAAGVELGMAINLMRYVWERPKGELRQEIGGVGLTLLALANAAQWSADACEISEIQRVLGKPLEHFAARNQSKNDAGFLCGDGQP